MKIFLTLLALSIVCSAQSLSSRFEEEHARGVEQNPLGVTLTISTADGGSAYHLWDVIRFRLSFASTKLYFYTVELNSGNSAGTSHDFVIQGPGIAIPIHSHPIAQPGVVCCDSNRRYVRLKPLGTVAYLDFMFLERNLNMKSLPHPPTPPMHFEPGDYTIFVQTRSVMRGWPKSDHARYHDLSDTVVTSSNVLHITILPVVPIGEEKPQTTH